MNSDATSNDKKAQQSNAGIGFYVKALEGLITGKGYPTNEGNFELDEYIAAFSLYMVKANDAYKYNLAYLNLEHEKYKTFLLEAIAKVALFKDIIMAIKSSKNVEKLLQENLRAKEGLRISLNDFFISDLSGKIEIAEEARFQRVTANSRDRLTVTYRDNARCCIVTDEDNPMNEKPYNKIVAIVEGMIQNERSDKAEKP